MTYSFVKDIATKHKAALLKVLALVVMQFATEVKATVPYVDFLSPTPPTNSPCVRDQGYIPLVSAHACTVYVDDVGGDDSQALNPNVCPAKPIKSTRAANRYIRNANLSPLTISFKRGGDWRIPTYKNCGDIYEYWGSLTIGDKLYKPTPWGRNNLTINSYGTGAYPKIHLQGSAVEFKGLIDISGSSNITVSQLYIYAENPVDNIGVYISGSGGNMKLEDVVINGFYHNVVAQPGYDANDQKVFDDLTLNRVKIINSRSPILNFTNHGVEFPYSSSSGIYINDAIKRLYITDSVFANNGHQLDPAKTAPHHSFYNHQIYIGGDGTHFINNVSISGTVFLQTFPYAPDWYENNVKSVKDFSAEKSSFAEGADGVKGAGAGALDLNDNLFYGNQQPVWAIHEPTVLVNNVFLQATALSLCSAGKRNCSNQNWGGTTNSATPSVGSLCLGNNCNGYSSPTHMSQGYLKNNLFAHTLMGSSVLNFNGFDEPDFLHKPKVHNNIIFDVPRPDLPKVTISNTQSSPDFTPANFALKNDVGLAASRYPAPSRSLENYAAGGNSALNLLKLILAQGPGVWANAYRATYINDYLRAGFGLAQVNSANSQTSPVYFLQAATQVGLCADLKDYTSYQLYTCHNGANQQLFFSGADGVKGPIRVYGDSSGTTKCVDSSQGLLQARPCNNSTSQQFSYDKTLQHLIDGTGKCVDVKQNQLLRQQPMQTATCSTQPSQLWRLVSPSK